MTGTLMKLCETSAAITALDRDRQSLVTERDALIKKAWAAGSGVVEIADCAALSHGRISQITDPRPAGRPRRAAQP